MLNPKKQKITKMSDYSSSDGEGRKNVEPDNEDDEMEFQNDSNNSQENS
jgi:hypothetical protein